MTLRHCWKENRSKFDSKLPRNTLCAESGIVCFTTKVSHRFLPPMSAFTGSEYANWVASALQMQLDPRLQVFEQCHDGEQIERGIRTTASVPANSTLAIVPFASLITVETSKDYDPIFAALREQLREDDMLALVILHEKYKSTASRWHPHFAFIPTVYHSIINYTEDELEWIKGSNLYDIAYRWREQVKEDFASLINTLNAAQFDQTAFLGESLSFETYLWCLCTIWSRCITVSGRQGRDFRCVVPYVDLLNHNPSSKVGHAYHDASDSLYLATGQAFGVGEEICLHYGPCSNSRLLMLYGFALSHNVYDSVDLFASMGRREDALDIEDYDTKMQTLQLCGLPHAEGEAFHLTLSDERTVEEQNLLAFLRIQHADTATLRSLLATANRHPRDAVQQPLSKENEETALRAAMSTIRQMLETYKTTLPQDILRLRELTSATSTAIAGESGFLHPSQRALHALYVVMGEKKVLHKVAKRFDQLLQAHLQAQGRISKLSA